MSFRFMRVIVFFDLPVETPQNRKDYRCFRKFLLKTGFMMMQESVYSKLILNATAAKAVMENVRKNSPDGGLIQMMLVTEKQYNNIELVIGEASNDIVSTTDRLVIL